MKKISTLLLSAGLLAFAAGCTSSEIIDEGAPELRGAISFGTTNVSKPSRTLVGDGVSLSNTNLDEFYVYGSYTTEQGRKNVFNGVKTTKAEGETEWKYEGGDRFWVPKAIYSFAAFSCGGTFDPNTTGLPTYATYDETGKLNFKGYVCHNHDLIYASTQEITGKETGNEKVNLQFKHILTRLKFSFECKTPGSAYSIELSDVVLSGMINSADFSGATETWGNFTVYNDQVASENLDFVGSSNLVPDNSKVTSDDEKEYLECKPVFVIPNKYLADKNDVNLKFTMTVKSGSEVILERKVVATWTPEWLQGKSMNNIVNIDFQSASGLEPIRFSAEVVGDTGAEADGWVPADGGLTGKQIEFRVDTGATGN